MPHYKTEYKRLNKAQREAVETTEGPLLVIAGPGTGKTELLASRVAHILASTDTQAENILCLTFTNKAAVNMKKRIIAIAGQAGAKAVVKTFHSLASEIMNMYPDAFWNAAKLSNIPEPVQIETIQSILEDLDVDHPLALKFAGQFTLVDDVKKSIGLCKEAGLNPDKLRAIIQTNKAYIEVIEPELIEILAKRLSTKSIDDLRARLAGLPDHEIKASIKPLLPLSSVLLESFELAAKEDEGSDKTTHMSKWKSQWLQTVDGQKSMVKQRDRNEWWLKLADVYEDYRDAIHGRGYYDYSDMLVEVLSVLESSPKILADIQERFNYVMIDEFQDTNPAQLRLSHLIADHATTESRPNIMAVGDDDQAIYKFNGALVSNMAEFKRSYPSLNSIVLKENYRSSQNIIDSAEKVITGASYRLVNIDKTLDKKLQAVNDIQPSLVEVKAYQTSEEQYSDIARKIKSAYSKDRQVAILARSHESLIKMAGILNQLKVPIRYEKQSNILDNEIIIHIYHIFRLVEAINEGDKPMVDSLIHKILRAPMWQVSTETLWQMALDNARKPDWLKYIKNSEDKATANFYSWLKAMNVIVSEQPLALSIEYALGLRGLDQVKSPIKNYYLKDRASSHEYLVSLSAIQLIRSLVHEYSANDQPKAYNLCRLIEISRQNNKIIADESPYISGENPVNLLSVHKAKGLEFDDVYVIDAVDSVWSPSNSGRKPPANLPLQPLGDDIDDYVRLMYVAITRARQNIFISGYKLDHAGREVAISSIILSSLDVVDAKGKVDIIEALEQSISWPRLSTGNEKQMLKASLEGYQLSVTHLINFLGLANGGPQYFVERNLLRLPEPKPDHLAYGTAIHKTLEFAHVEKQPSIKSIQDIFAKYLLEEQLSNKSYAKNLQKGDRLLDKLFNDFKLEFDDASSAEQDLKDVKLGASLIRGKIDRIDFAENGLIVTDYKTGGSLASFESRDMVKQERIWRHKLQLTFYALLIQSSPRFTKYKDREIEGQMAYLEVDDPSKLNLRYQPTDEEIADLAKLINIVYQKIIDYDIPDVSKYSPDFAGTKNFEQDLLQGKI